MNEYQLPLLIPFVISIFLEGLLLFRGVRLASLRVLMAFYLAVSILSLLPGMLRATYVYWFFYHYGSMIEYAMMIWISSELFSLITHTRTEKIVLRYILGIMLISAFLKTAAALHWLPWLTFGILGKLLVAVPLLWTLEWSDNTWTMEEVDIVSGLVIMLGLGVCFELLGTGWEDRPPIWLLSLYQWPAVIGFAVWTFGLRNGSAKAKGASV